MKYFLIIIGLLITSSNIFSQSFNNPESIVFDKSNDRYLVSNANTGSNKGEILSLDPHTQEISQFISKGLNSPKGLIIVNNTIFCTDLTEVKGFDLSTGSLTTSIMIEESLFLNDITSDGINLFVSDNIKNKIFSINISTHKVTTLISGGDLSKPNGILYNQEKNSLIICSFRANSPIQSYDLNLNMLSFLIMTNISQMDGITIDQNGNYYVSSWNDNAIYKFDPLFKDSPIQISNGHYGPADIFYDIQNDVLAIPNFNSNAVNLMNMSPLQTGLDLNPNEIKIYPNPTSGLFTINFKRDIGTFVSIQIMDKSGNILHKVAVEKYSDKEYQDIVIDSKSIGLKKGVYFIKINIGEDVFMKRIAIL